MVQIMPGGEIQPVAQAPIAVGEEPEPRPDPPADFLGDGKQPLAILGLAFAAD